MVNDFECALKRFRKGAIYLEMGILSNFVVEYCNAMLKGNDLKMKS